MNERERVPHEPLRLGPTSGPLANPGGANLEALRQQADALLAESDAIIRAELSTNSDQFLKAALQHGGQ